MVRFTEFRGLVAPVFVPCKEDGNVDYNLIDKYGNFLKEKNVNGILVNGTTGEGTLLSLEERMKIAEEWKKTCTKYDISMMLMISGCNLKDVEQLANHAENIGVDGVLCLPELYHKPNSIEKLVSYLKLVSSFCPSLPLYYYNYPAKTGVDLDMAEFMTMANKEISQFSGIKYTSGDLAKCVLCLKLGQVFLGGATIALGGYALGVNSGIMTVANIFPEYLIAIEKHLSEGNLSEARREQYKMNDEIREILEKYNFEWTRAMKSTFNERFPELHMGSTRKPL